MEDGLIFVAFSEYLNFNNVCKVDDNTPPSALAAHVGSQLGTTSTANDSSFIERTHNLSIEGKDFITILHTYLLTFLI